MAVVAGLRGLISAFRAGSLTSEGVTFPNGFDFEDIPVITDNLQATVPARCVTQVEKVPASSATSIHASITQPTTTDAVVTTGITNPAVYRVLSVTGNQSTCAGNIVIKGTDWSNNPISDTIALAGTATVNGVKAFKTVTSISNPVRAASGDTFSVGTASIFGLWKPISATTDVIVSAKLVTLAATGDTGNSGLLLNTPTIDAVNSTIATAVSANDVLFLIYMSTKL